MYRVIVFSCLLATMLCSAAWADTRAAAQTQARTLMSVEALNSAAYGVTRVAVGDRCDIYAGGAIKVIETRSSGQVMLEYQPALVFMGQDGRLVNNWRAFREQGVSYCPPGTLFEVEGRLIDAWEQGKRFAIIERRSDSGQWVCRQIEKARNPKIAISDEMIALLSVAEMEGEN